MITAKRVAAILIGLSGIAILVVVLYPIVSYELEARTKYPQLISPISETSSANLPDYTKASSWFDKDYMDPGPDSKVSHYQISVPKLGIKDAVVEIGGEDLSESLIHYPGTSVPGKNGNAVIFGHSILPQFYNPTNYLSIFSTLPTLEIGDEIFVSYDGIDYKYKVEEMFDVKPTDIQILDQDKSDSFLTLVTCTPPGDPRRPKRLIVRARIVNLNQANAN